MAMLEDTAAFFNTAEFADTATLNSVPVRGIFDSAYDNAGVGMVGMASSQPAFTLPSADAPASSVGKTLVVTSGVGAGTYKVVEVHPDGTGFTLLLLERSA